jgi:hypothetical protein
MESAWWGCRIAVLQALCLVAKNENGQIEGALKRWDEQLDLVNQDNDAVKDQMTLYLKTHCAMIENPNMTLEQTIAFLR